MLHIRRGTYTAWHYTAWHIRQAGATQNESSLVKICYPKYDIQIEHKNNGPTMVLIWKIEQNFLICSGCWHFSGHFAFRTTFSITYVNFLLDYLLDFFFGHFCTMVKLESTAFLRGPFFSKMQRENPTDGESEYEPEKEVSFLNISLSLSKIHISSKLFSVW